MKKIIFVLLAVPILLVLVLVLPKMRWKHSKRSGGSAGNGELVVTNAVITTVSPSANVPASKAAPLLGETILRDYANPNLAPENDLTLMSRLMENSLLLLKAAGNRPLSANEDWADLWRGKNAAREEFLPAQSIALNDKGQLIDRWQTPLFFHALGGGRYEIRSAGPDKQMWTADDIQRNSNGTFLRATNNPSEPQR